MHTTAHDPKARRTTPALAANGFPRRNCLDHNTPVELAIRQIVHDVESLGADVLLTDAVNLLHEAREKVADFIERQ